MNEISSKCTSNQRTRRERKRAACTNTYKKNMLILIIYTGRMMSTLLRVKYGYATGRGKIEVRGEDRNREQQQINVLVEVFKVILHLLHTLKVAFCCLSSWYLWNSDYQVHQQPREAVLLVDCLTMLVVQLFSLMVSESKIHEENNIG